MTPRRLSPEDDDEVLDDEDFEEIGDYDGDADDDIDEDDEEDEEEEETWQVSRCANSLTS